ncbi:MAG: glycoside hydrolase family 88 protein [Chitinophagaceae bacterium]
MITIRFTFLFILLAASQSHAQMEYAKSMAKTIMEQYQDSMVVKKYASHLEQDNLIKPGQTVEEAQASRPANWNYEIGVVLMGFERLWKITSDKSYIDYAKHIIDHFITADGSIRTYVQDEYNSDNIPPGRQLLYLDELYKDAKYKTAATTLRNQIAWQPRNRVGGFWHKLKYPSQMWLDGLYMVEPFYANYAVVHQQPEDFNDIINQFVWMEKYSRDTATGLLYHGWDESKLQRWANPKTGLSPEFWSRSIGWYIMALVDVLDYIPAKHPRRNELVQILKRLSKAIIAFQDKPNGVWWQVTNKGGKEGNYLESSATAMFVFGLAKAVRMGYISKTYLPAVNKAYAGMIKEFVRQDAAGKYHYIQAVAGAGLGGIPYRDGSYDYYIKEPKRDDDLKAIGPFMQACIEMELLKKRMN